MIVADHAQLADVVLLRVGATEAYWNRGRLVNAMVGTIVLRIQATEIGFFLYLSDVGIVLISTLIEHVSGRPFLHWDLTD